MGDSFFFAVVRLTLASPVSFTFFVFLLTFMVIFCLGGAASVSFFSSLSTVSSIILLSLGSGLSISSIVFCVGSIFARLSVGAITVFLRSFINALRSIAFKPDLSTTVVLSFTLFEGPNDTTTFVFVLGLLFLFNLSRSWEDIYKIMI